MEKQIDYYAIAAASIDNRNPAEPKYWIGEKGDLPWGRNLPTDLNHLHKILRQQKTATIMGRRTFKSIPKDKLPIQGSTHNIIISSKLTQEAIRDIQNTYIVSSFKSAILLAQQLEVSAIAACGGHGIYEAALTDPHFTKIYLTIVHGKFNKITQEINEIIGDTEFPDPNEFFKISKEGPHLMSPPYYFQFTQWERISFPA